VVQEDVSIIVFAGGMGTRLGGVKKATIDVGGRPVIERVLEATRPLGREIILVDNDDSLATLPGVRIVPDSETRAGVLVALASGLSAATSELCLVVGCDMPFLSQTLLRWLLELSPGFVVVLPVNEGFMDPMHAVYRREPVLGAVERAIARGDKRMTSYLPDVRVREVGPDELRARDPELRSFFNINTPEDLERARALAA
jgi:molybdopterin-guanine dinucleotide biosynthesis protein A